MRRTLLLLLSVSLIFNSKMILAQVSGTPEISFISPKAGSYLNGPGSNILIRFTDPVLLAGKAGSAFEIVANGLVLPFSSALTEDARTLILQPLKPLPVNTKITVRAIKNIQLLHDKTLNPFNFYFYATGNISSEFINNEANAIELNKKKYQMQAQTQIGSSANQTLSTKSILNDRTTQIPIDVLTNKKRAEGYYFISTICFNASYPNRCMILDNNGRLIYERLTPDYCLDFKMLNDTLFSYFDWDKGLYYVLNSSFNTVDSVTAGNGYITDNHELQIDPKTGHYFLLAQHLVTVDMRDSVTDGNQNAKVLGLIIQELDKDKKVVFEWKTIDHLPVTDAIGVDLSGSVIDYIHCNAIDLDTDTTLLLSSRHLCEVERIDRRTGQLIWRLGKKMKINEFIFDNDTAGFSYQHDARRLPNGNILLFDNANQWNGPPNTRGSRAVEYYLNEDTKVAIKVWEYYNNPNVLSDFMGSAQRLPSGNVLIGWGGTTPTLTEIDASKHKVFEISLPLGTMSYRAFKYENIRSLIESNQARIPALSDTLNFCNDNALLVLGNYESYIKPLIPSTIPEEMYDISIDNRDVTIATENSNNFYAYIPCYLNFVNAYLNQTDTIVCEGTSKFKLAMHDDCKNLKFKWSTNDTTPSIMVDPASGPKTYWVEMRNGSYYKKDSVKIGISKVDNFDILGEQVVTEQYKILTYSVPFEPFNKYRWEVKNGNIINGYGTNAVTVQWGNKDFGTLKTIITDPYGCNNSFTDTVLIKTATATGIANMIQTGKLQVYPNPVKDILNIESDDAVTYSLLDISGKELIVSKEMTKGMKQIDMADLSPGYYLLTISTPDKTDRIKIMKQ